MNKKKLLLIAAGLIPIFAIMIFLANRETTNAQECRVIRIHGLAAHGSIKIEPETLVVSRGTCVIWFNRSTTNEVKVIFEEGKKCEDVTDAPTGFTLDAANCYVTSWIPFGGTSSLRFNEEGTYGYVLEATGGIKEKGSILVQP